jgi:cyclophilin family peptidyl-prolyl cis-trans isomerase
MVISKSKHYQVKLYTQYGLITADILPKLAPITANNFVFLACNGFFDNLTFHRVVPNFVIQGGDPKGNGTGGPGYQFKDEPVARGYQIGDLAMANSGANTNGSQFFVIQGKDGVSLPHSYSLFGHVTSGENVVNLIATAPSNATAQTPNSPVHITKVTVQIT